MPSTESKRSLTPLGPITAVSGSGPTVYSEEEITSESVGSKAYGLASLPSEWVPPYFIVIASCYNKHISEKKIDAWITQSIDKIGISACPLVIIRSSGTSETMQNRGQLLSKHCTPKQVGQTIRELIQTLPQGQSSNVHWVVQKYVNQKEKGHLSNERRLRKENRDWVVEYEPQAYGHGDTTGFAVRQWRDGTEIEPAELRCTSRIAITVHLKHVAIWATQLSSRAHFEWVWSGGAIYVVQVDLAGPGDGIDPRSILPSEIKRAELASLQSFHKVSTKDYERYSKLRNTKLYSEQGYTIPEYYVLNSEDTIRDILAGTIPQSLDEDISELTKRPLIIRTDGLNLTAEKQELLPRSEELRSSDEAKKWLLDRFKPDIEKSGLGNRGLCLIAHHFIPSVSSAWARAVPGNRIVRIESLWGIPEGLYWYSHDTFEVDTLTVDISADTPIQKLKYKYSKRLRYKGTFIGSDDDGKWIPYPTAGPFDWSRSIKKESWLYEIARTTRQIAEREKHSISMMWFIENHAQATAHEVLPWYHMKAELSTSLKAAPRQKRRSSRDFSVKDTNDWLKLQKDLQSGKHIERVVVEPVDPEIIRNKQFAEDLADLSASKKFVVELSGGILSHVYYTLQRRGANVECVDLFGADEDVIEYDKVVRDKVPKFIEERGERVTTVKLKSDALVTALQQKLVEESFEALDATSGHDLIGELADIIEVVRGLCIALNVDVVDVEAEREKKEENKGGFEKGIMLIKTVTPHSIQKQQVAPNHPTLELKQQFSEPIISDASNLPAKPMYRRPDLRKVGQESEKLFTFEVEANKIEEVKEALNFLMPIRGQSEENFSISVELKRIHSMFRGTVRLRYHPTSQTQIEFPDQIKIEFPK